MEVLVVSNMNNYKILSFMRILKSTIELFVSNFFVMYFLSVSNNNVPKLGSYYIIVYATVFLTIYIYVKIFVKQEKE